MNTKKTMMNHSEIQG